MRIKFRIIFFLLFVNTTSLQAAALINVWEDPAKLSILNQFSYDNKTTSNKISSKAYLLSNKKTHGQSHQQFKLANAESIDGASHVRYDQLYQGLPVWGMQIIVHHKKHTKVTGSIVTGIANDIKSITPKLSNEAAKAIVVKNLQQEYAGHQLSLWRNTRITPLIYFKASQETIGEGKAVLAYHITFFSTDMTTKKLLRPVYLIDANQGDILQHYNNLHTDGVGTGPGGNDITGLTMRNTNNYQFGNASVGPPSLGFLPVTVSGGNCIMLTSQVRLSSYNNVPGSDYDFPIEYADEGNYPIFSYACNSGTLFKNANDGTYAPVVNGAYHAYSPSNDTFYFAQMTYQMMQTFIPTITNPWGADLPIRIYTHVGLYDNAFAIAAVDDDSQPITDFHSQFVVGNGDELFYPLSDAGTVAHELSHLYTSYHSNLIYDNQSGAINEAYSDIAGQTLEFYLSQLYPWYGFGWDIGSSVSLPSGPFAGKALRYFDYPPKDGFSIANAAQFHSGLNVHYGSGVYNYAFYLMVAKYGMNLYHAYQYFSHANAAYWQPSSSYEFASCGVMQAAIDQDNRNDFDIIVSAFKNVGVQCKIGFKKLLSPL